MGFAVKFNWVLQFELEEKIEEGCSYQFAKTGNRCFPVETAIDLIDSKRTAIAKIKIKSFTNSLNATSGVFEIVKIYSGEEKNVLSNYWSENE
jgi:hypothetical protein